MLFDSRFQAWPSNLVLPHGKQTRFGNNTKPSRPPNEGCKLLDHWQETLKWIIQPGLIMAWGPGEPMLLHKWTEIWAMEMCQPINWIILHSSVPQLSWWSSALLAELSNAHSEEWAAIFGRTWRRPALPRVQSFTLLYIFRGQFRSYQCVSLSKLISVLSYKLPICLAALSNRLWKRGACKVATLEFTPWQALAKFTSSLDRYFCDYRLLWLLSFYGHAVF